MKQSEISMVIHVTPIYKKRRCVNERKENFNYLFKKTNDLEEFNQIPSMENMKCRMSAR
jgi:hypothetical protein